MRKYLSLIVGLLLLATPAMADWTGKDASGATITFKNSGTCSSVVCVPVAQPVDGTGAAFGVTGNPFFMSFASGVTLPAFTTTPTFNLGTLNGAATAVKQPALGTAGSPSTDVLSVQGVTGGTPQPVSAASGAIVDGADVAQGSTTSTACPASGTATVVGCVRTLAQAQTTPLNNSSVAINVSTATTTQLVALSGTTVIYVTSYDVIAGGTGNITFEYGTGTNCGTGTTALTGAYNLTAQAGIAKGSGIGTILKVPAGNALCVLTSAAVQMSGSVSFQQF